LVPSGSKFDSPGMFLISTAMRHPAFLPSVSTWRSVGTRSNEPHPGKMTDASHGAICARVLLFTAPRHVVVRSSVSS
jgi:hypothetical protein